MWALDVAKTVQCKLNNYYFNWHIDYYFAELFQRPIGEGVHLRKRLVDSIMAISSRFLLAAKTTPELLEYYLQRYTYNLSLMHRRYKFFIATLFDSQCEKTAAITCFQFISDQKSDIYWRSLVWWRRHFRHLKEFCRLHHPIACYAIIQNV